MKKTLRKLQLRYYRRLLCKYFRIYLREGLSSHEADAYARKIVSRIRAYREIPNLSRLASFLEDRSKD